MKRGVCFFFILCMALAVLPAQARRTPITVRLTNGANENQRHELDRQQLLIAEFLKIRPDVVIRPNDTVFDRQAFAAKLAGNTMEDAFLVSFTEPRFLIERKYVADITDYLRKWEGYPYFNSAVLDIVSDSNGRIYGIPVNGYTLGLMYNRKLFAEAGLDPDKPPRTWEELREYAIKLTDPSKGRVGFVECSKSGQGGWHFVALSYTFGGTMVRQEKGKWIADFTNPGSLKAAELLQKMRWEDESMTQQQMLDVKDIMQLLASGRVAMAVMAGDMLRTLKEQYQADMNDWGMGPMPQGGGNATLTGGAAWMFNPKSSPEVLEAAVQWVLFNSFDKFETDIQMQAQRGQLVGWPQLSIFNGPYEAKRQEIISRLANAPIRNYIPYVSATHILPKPELSVETQKLYVYLDSVMQALLTDPLADARTVLTNAQRMFQRQVLDRYR
jgi:ABC-type glycerol-3-phosphate transport system substrate-binding protein